MTKARKTTKAPIADVAPRTPSAVALADLPTSRIPIAAITWHPDNPRKHLDPLAIGELAASIAVQGVLSPILVRPWPADQDKPNAETTHQGIVGYRRLVASASAGLVDIPAIVRDVSDADVLEIMQIENLQRADIHPLEEAAGFAAMIQRQNGGEPVTPQYIADRIGKSVPYVRRRLQLAQLHPDVRDWGLHGQLPLGALQALAALPPDAQRAIFNRPDQKWLQQQLAKGGRVEASHLSHLIREQAAALRDAPWSLADATLYPEAGPCTTCPKRTDAAPELFAEFNSSGWDGDNYDDENDAPVVAANARCLDPACFAVKRTRFVQLRAAKAESQLPKKNAPHAAVVYLSESYHHKGSGTTADSPLAREQWTEASDGESLAAHPCLRIGVTVDAYSKDRIGRIHRVCVDRKCKNHRRYTGLNAENNSWRRQQDRKAMYTKAELAAVLEAALAAYQPAKLSPTVATLVRTACYGIIREMWSDGQKRAAQTLKLERPKNKKKTDYSGWDDVLRTHVAAVTPTDLQRTLLTLVLAREVTPNEYTDDRYGLKPLLPAFAESVGVNVAAVRRKASAELRAKHKEQDAAARKRKRAKAKRDAAAPPPALARGHNLADAARKEKEKRRDQKPSAQDVEDQAVAEA